MKAINSIIRYFLMLHPFNNDNINLRTVILVSRNYLQQSLGKPAHSVVWGREKFNHFQTALPPTSLRCKSTKLVPSSNRRFA